jgi:hypothetical protein
MVRNYSIHIASASNYDAFEVSPQTALNWSRDDVEGLTITIYSDAGVEVIFGKEAVEFLEKETLRSL